MGSEVAFYQSLGPLSLTNFGKYAIWLALQQGVAPETIVVLLLLPSVAAGASFLHYVVGFSGFGIFLPTALAVTLWSTGITGGLVLFVLVFLVTLVVRRLLRRVKLHYWPRRAITLWAVSLATLGLLVLAEWLALLSLTKISVFPLLFTILLVEEFIRVQQGKSRKEAIRGTLGSLLLAIVGAALMRWSIIQRAVLLQPEISMFVILAVNLIVGRYTGFRLTEFKRFKPVLRS